MSNLSFDFEDIRRRTLRGPRLNSLLDSFERIAAGVTHVPQSTPEAAPDFVQRSAAYELHQRLFKKNIGTFFRHGCASIPYCIEQYARVDIALCNLAAVRRSDGGGPLTYWETSSADGTRARTLAEYARGDILTLTDSPNEANRRQFESLNSHPYSFFHCGSFVDITPEFLAQDAPHAAFRDHFDVIWENTTFQMYGRDRTDQIAYLKRVLKDGGLMLFFEKMNGADEAQYASGEHLKDSWFKSRYFTASDLALKRAEILQQMELCQVTLDEFVESAKVHFTSGALIWNCGNFYELVASDSPELLESFLAALPEPYVPAEFILAHPMVRRIW